MQVVFHFAEQREEQMNFSRENGERQKNAIAVWRVFLKDYSRNFMMNR